jgi:hypothetical protein
LFCTYCTVTIASPVVPSPSVAANTAITSMSLVPITNKFGIAAETGCVLAIV